MSDAHESDITSPPVPAVAKKVSVPTITSNALVPTSEVYDGVPIVSNFSLQSVEQAFVHSASYIASVGPVFGQVFAKEAEIDLDDIAGATLPHVIENLIAQALPTTYYYS